MRIVALLAATPSLLEILGHGVLAIVAYSIVGVILLLLGYFVVDVLTPGRLGAIIRTEGNPNAAALTASVIFALTLVIVAAIFTSGGNLAEGLVETVVFGLVGILAQAAASLVFDRVIGMDVRGLMEAGRLRPATVLVSVTRVSIGLITMFALI